ncbi:IS21 family transposase, partial [Rhodococcus sp. IEGM 1401]|nr:IS21 family transposase [Rhodococcus sp. IEGM 1401]MDI9924387.1 IS21 family transposase [Rhodococcus sp. IEGM 1372]
TIARHRLAADGTGAMVRDHGHVYALEQAAMAGANTGRPHRRKERIPPGPDALAAANILRTVTGTTHPDSADIAEQVSAATESATEGAIVYDLSVYERAAHGRNTL